MKLAFVGAGKMATAIAAGLIDNHVWSGQDILASDINETAREAFEKATGVVCAASTERIMPEADIVLLAVKPQVAAEVVAAIAPACAGKLVVSIAAGLKLETLAGWFGTRRVVRVMPNTPAMVGKGAAVFACGDGVSETDRDQVSKIFGAVGIVYEMGEDKIDAVTALSGSGPAYVFETIQALVEAAVAIGLPAEVSLELAAQTVAGAAEMVQRKLGTPDDLRVAVTSPGGTTAAGLAVMAGADYRGLFKNVLTAARDRSVELGNS